MTMLASASRALSVAVLAALLLAGPSSARDEQPPELRPTPRSAEAPDPDGGVGPRSLQEPVVYKPPRRGSPRNKMAGATRGAPALPQPLALAPDHVAHTLARSPSLYWYIDGVPPETARVVFTLTRDDAAEPLREVELPHPARAGIHHVRLSDYGVTLERGVEYGWSISLSPDPSQHEDDVVSTAWVRRVGGDALGGRAPSPSAYADAGLWYDALASLSEAIDSGGDPELRAARNSLLRQAHLDAAVE
jgi:hypothetical protein